MRKARHRLGTILVVSGVLLMAYASAVIFWRDPVTDLYARYQQHKLDSELARLFEAYERRPLDQAAASTAALAKEITVDARRYEAGLARSAAMGRLVIPRLDLDVVFVHGTRWGPDLSKGPGHYERTSVPGLGETTAIAGHRTTFGAPFRKIDRLEAGDEIVVKLPYGTFRYEVFEHEIVDDEDWTIVRGRGFDTLVLSACHPLYSASQRWIVYGRLTEVKPVGRESYVLAAEGEAVLAG